MDIIVLGLLMIKASTIYEMRKAIETNLTNISSSVGSIQAARKKLLDAAKIGQLCLDKGNCNGKQIVSSKEM